MSDKLISADRMIRNLYQMIDDGIYSGITFEGMIRGINEAPAVDAVEVVRCSQCEHWKKDVAGCTDFIGRCEWANYMVGATGFCVYGERREENAVD